MKKSIGVLMGVVFGVMAYLLVSAYSPGQTEEEIVFVRIIEYSGQSLGNPMIILTRGEVQRKVDLDRNNLRNPLTIAMTFSQLSSEGYHIVGSNAKGDSGVMITDYVLSNR